MGMAKLGFSCKRCIHFCTQDEKARVIFKGYCDRFESVASEVAKNNTVSESSGLEMSNTRIETMKQDWEKISKERLFKED